MNFKGNGVVYNDGNPHKRFVAQRISTVAKNIKVVKRDGRHTAFDDQKIYDALIKAETKIKGSVDPLAHERIQSIVERVDAEISERFTSDIKIYEIQNIVEHTLLEHNEYELAEEYINYRTRRDFQRSKATDINFTIGKLINKDQTVVNENANKDSDVLTHNAI